MSTRPSLPTLLTEIRACLHCVAPGMTKPLPLGPRPILQASTTARLAICSQAPGTRAHSTGIPFNDRSGIRLREWMGATDSEFYDASRIAILPMGFCFPGQDAKGGDLPPRPECAPLWRNRLFGELPQLELLLLVGRYAQVWHLGARCRTTLTETVQAWQSYLESPERPRCLPLPHPSWRNTAWLKANPFFTDDMLPHLRLEVRRLLE